jgi:hypothetical protein
VSHPSFTGDDKDEVYAAVGFVTGVTIPTEFGNCRLLQTVCVPIMGAGVEVAYAEPTGPWLVEEAVGLTTGFSSVVLLLESIVGVSIFPL